MLYYNEIKYFISKLYFNVNNIINHRIIIIAYLK